MLFLISCSGEKNGINMTGEEIIETFNKVAKDTDYRLESVIDNGDGTITLKNNDRDTSKVVCTVNGDEVVRIDIYGVGIFQPGMAAYDYMAYTMMACDKSTDWEGSANFIADLYYETTSGAEPSIAGYNGLVYEFRKTEYCIFTIKNP